MRAFALLCLLIMLAGPAFAQPEDPLLALPEGQLVLNISATERQEVEQDLLVATLSYNAENRDARALQDEINKAMADALAEAKKADEVKTATGAYRVYEYTEQRTREKRWRGSQSLTLKSKDAEALLALAGKLQDMKLTMGGLSYTLAPETAVEIQDRLMEAALKQLQTRADRAAAALGKSSAALREVNVQSGHAPRPVHHQMRVMQAEAMAAPMAAPVAEAGETTITLSVSARAILKP